MGRSYCVVRNLLTSDDPACLSLLRKGASCVLKHLRVLTSDDPACLSLLRKGASCVLKHLRVLTSDDPACLSLLRKGASCVLKHLRVLTSDDPACLSLLRKGASCVWYYQTLAKWASPPFDPPMLRIARTAQSGHSPKDSSPQCGFLIAAVRRTRV
jgi:hypothetical protein